MQGNNIKSSNKLFVNKDDKQMRKDRYQLGGLLEKSQLNYCLKLRWSWSGYFNFLFSVN